MFTNRLRVFEFRAYSIATGKMMDWDFISSVRNMNKLLTLDHVRVMQFTGLLDKNKKKIYEGDVVRAYHLETEYQTHCGDNIPLGSYTEPCGIIAKVLTKEVVYASTSFTTAPCNFNFPEDVEEYQWEQCMLHLPKHTRETLEDIIFPRPHHLQHERVSDEEFFEVAKDICSDEFKIEISSIEHFIEVMNGIEVIGNIYENNSLIKQHDKCI